MLEQTFIQTVKIRVKTKIGNALFWSQPGRMLVSTVFILAVVFFLNQTGWAQTDSSDAQLTLQSEAVADFERAQTAHERGELAEAVKLYETALTKWKEFPEAEYQRGAALISLRRPNEAEAAFRRAVELRPDWSLPAATLGALLVKSKKPDEAEKLLTQAIALDANNFPAFVALTELRLTQNAPPAALNGLLAQLRGLTTGKTNVPAAVWTARARLERQTGDRPAAQKSLERALSYEPRNVAALLLRADLLREASDFGEAAETVKTVLQIVPDDSEAVLLLARIYIADNQLTEAARVLDALDSTAKNSPEVVRLRGQLAIDLAPNGEGVQALEKLLADDPKNIVALGQLCRLTRTIDAAKALDYCRRANQLEPTSITHFVGYGAALVQVKQYQEAIQILRRALAAESGNRAARVNLATALYQSERFAEAVSEYQWLIAAEPERAVSYYFLATAHDRLGEYPQALQAYNRFLELSDAKQNQAEIERVNLRLPILKRQVEKGAGKKPKK